MARKSEDFELKQKSTFADLKSLASLVAEQIPGLKLLVLFGSRARGNNQVDSDWDFAVLYDEKLFKSSQKDSWGWLKIQSILSKIFDLSEDEIDVVDLQQCSPWLAHCIARDGKLLFEKEAGEFEQFRQTALKSAAELKEYRQTVREKVRSALQRWKK
ncbi:MAG: nucleotidyltransferase domain-containing protein [Phormidium sp.]